MIGATTLFLILAAADPAAEKTPAENTPEKPSATAAELTEAQIEQYLLSCSRGRYIRLEQISRQAAVIQAKFRASPRLPANREARTIMLRQQREAREQLEDLEREAVNEAKKANLPDPELALPLSVGAVGNLPVSRGIVRAMLDPPNLVHVTLDFKGSNRRTGSSAGQSVVIDFGSPQQFTDRQEIDISGFFECIGVHNTGKVTVGVLRLADEAPYQEWVRLNKADAKAKMTELQARR